MDRKTQNKIKQQIRLKKRERYCFHDSKKVCNKCMKNIRGNLSGITGDLSGITGDLTDITGNLTNIKATADEIRKVLKGATQEG